MKLSQLFSIIKNIAKEKGISEVFCCGGAPRDRVLGRFNDINDIDLTTGDQGIHFLAKEVSIKFGSSAHYLVLPDGHARVMLGKTKLDFSSNFRAPNIENILKDKGIENPTDLQMEVYSRDFTCNSLLMSMDLKDIYDPIGSGIQDLKDKIIRTCLDPKITLGSDNKRVVRILYLAAKLDFSVDPKIIAWVQENSKSFSNVRPQYLSKKLMKAFRHNPKITVSLLDQMNLWSEVPPLPELRPFLINRLPRISP